MHPVFVAFVTCALLTSCAVAPEPPGESVSAESVWRPMLHLLTRDRVADCDGVLIQEQGDDVLHWHYYPAGGPFGELELTMPFSTPGDAAMLGRGDLCLVSGFDERTACGHLLLLWLRSEPGEMRVLQHVRWPGCDPWRLAVARSSRTVYLQDRTTGWIHAIWWSSRCRPLPDLAELSPPLTSGDLYGVDLVEDYALFGDRDSLIVYRDRFSGSKPFWDPRFEVSWSPRAGWVVDWYYTSDDPDAWVIY